MMSHARGAKLFSEGDAARNVFVICFGQVKISSTSRDGKTMILKIAGPGDVMGLSAVLANVPHEVTAEAIEPCQVKQLSASRNLSIFLAVTASPACMPRIPRRGNPRRRFTTPKRLALWVGGGAAGAAAARLGHTPRPTASPRSVYHGVDA